MRFYEYFWIDFEIDNRFPFPIQQNAPVPLMTRTTISRIFDFFFVILEISREIVGCFIKGQIKSEWFYEIIHTPK